MITASLQHSIRYCNRLFAIEDSINKKYPGDYEKRKQLRLEMAKAHGLNIYRYLKFLLERRPDQNMGDEQLAELAPWSENSNLSKIVCELLQLAKSWGNFISDRFIIWRLPYGYAFSASRASV